MTNSIISPVIQTFLDIVQIDSPTGHEENMTQELSSRLSSYFLNPHVDAEGNVHVHIPSDSGLEPIFLNAHLDTVKPGRGIKPHIDPDGWIRSNGGTILGADNKAAVAAILSAVPNILQNNSRRPLDIFFTVSEEGNSHGAINFDYSCLKARNGYIFDVSDEDFGTIITSAPFYNRLNIKIIGKSGHAKVPENATNVLPVFIKAMSQLPLGRFSPSTIINIGTIRGGTSTNTIPGQLTLTGEIRSNLETELEQITNLYRQTFTDISTSMWATLSFESLRENPGYKITANNPFLQETISRLNNFGLKPQIKDSFGCADANYFASHGLTTIDIADGSQCAHTTEERIRVTDLEKLEKLIYFLVTNTNITHI